MERATAEEIISFGPFCLKVKERLLMRGDLCVDLGGRAMDVLLALIARENEIVSKDALMAEAWPGVVVSDGSLRYQITMLRQALGDGQDGSRYISNVVGRGYCFVSKISRQVIDNSEASGEVGPLEGSLPSKLSLMIGRSDDIAEVIEHLLSRRFVTIAGSGGVGKTTVATAIGHSLLKDFSEAVVFVDLATVADPDLVPTAISSMLRLSVRSSYPVPSLIAFLREKRMLLILDNCEHVIFAAASLAERILDGAPDVYVLATSREALRANGEFVQILNPFQSPPHEYGVTVQDIFSYPATQLFLDRANASGAGLKINNSDAVVIADICRQLDGLALAIELAARRVATYGLRQTASLLREKLSLSWLGQRTAQPRHQTLQATLDWSYDLLNDEERRVLCRLAVFVGYFSLDAARCIAGSSEQDSEATIGIISSLAEKFLITVQRSGSVVQYRLLESTRAYALSKAPVESLDTASLRHAHYYFKHLDEMAKQGLAFSRDAELASDLANLSNVRAALVWCFGQGGAAELGISLALAAIPAFMAKSLLAECHMWSERALRELSAASRGSPLEMHLQAALGLSQMFTRGNSDEVKAALERSLEVAEELGDKRTQVQLLGRLQIFHERIGDFVVSLSYAKRCAEVASTIDDSGALATANALVGLCNHLLGDQASAKFMLEAAIDGPITSRDSSSMFAGFDHHNRATIALARTLWLLGYPSQAVRVAHRAVEEARQLNHPVTLCIALIWAVSVYMWVGDYSSADQNIESFIACAESHSLTPYLAVGRGVKGELAVKRGDYAHGVREIQECLLELRESRYELLTSGFNLTVAEGLTASGRAHEALTIVDETLDLVHRKGDLYNLPELLRVKARALISSSAALVAEAESCLQESLVVSKTQGARSWELRSAIDLMRLLNASGRGEEGRRVLEDVVSKYSEGFETVDLREAATLLGRAL